MKRLLNFVSVYNKHHRQALQLIYEHAGSPAAGLIGEIERVVAEHSGGWHIVNRTPKQLVFIPESWLNLLPPIGSRATFDRRCWFVLRFEIRDTKGFLGATVWPTSDPKLRQKVIQRLTQEKEEFGFRQLLKKTSDHWSQLGRESIGSWSEEDGPDEETVTTAVRKKLDELSIRLSSIPDALGPIFIG